MSSPAHSGDLASWLALAAEEALDPALPIIDAHHHLWDMGSEPYLLREFLSDIAGGHNIESTIFVECQTMYRVDGAAELKPLGETEFALGQGAMSSSGQYGAARVAAGIIGHADLRLGDLVAGVLERHLAIAPARFRGVRYSTCFDPDPSMGSPRFAAPSDLMADEAFRSGVACLGRYGLVYDALLYHHQLPALAELARAVPGTTIVVNHVGSPLGKGRYLNRRAEVHEEWKKGIVLLKGCENVFLKLGGLGIPRAGFEWHARQAPPGSEELAKAFEPYYGHCIEQFGAARCMFESNFPVDRVSYSYTVLWNAFKRLAGSCSQGERAALFHGTAARVYRLAAPVSHPTPLPGH